jgi:hypothetical protein
MWARAGQLTCASLRGDPSLEQIFAVEGVLERGVLPAEEVLGLGAMATAYGRLGQWAAARISAERALDRMRRLAPATSYTLWSIFGVASVLLAAFARHRIDRTLHVASRDAVDILRSAARSMPVMAPRARVAAARAALLSGNVGAARRHYGAAAVAAFRLRMPIDEKLADAEMARLDAGYDAASALTLP